MAIRIDVRSTIKDTIAEIRADVEKATRAQVMALNRTAEQLRTEAGREVRKVYNLKLAAVRKASKLLRARKESRFPRAEVTFSGKKIPLIEFGARQTRQGVSVRIKMKEARKIVRGAFIATRRWTSWQDGAEQANKGVFRRVGKSRYPIRYLRSISIPTALEREAVAKALLAFVDDRFEKNFSDALIAALRR
jgi:hypothetical protein